MHLLVVLAVTLFSGPALSNEEAKFFVGKGRGNRIPYKLSLPDAYSKDKTKNSPLVLCLHGAGGRGADLTLTVNGEKVNETTGLDVVAGKIGLQSEDGEIHFRTVPLIPLDNE